MTRILLAAIAALLLLAIWQRGTIHAARLAEQSAEAAQAAAEAERDAANAALTRTNEVLAEERARADRLSEIGETHEQDRADAETVPAAVAADLRAGNLRLRQQWAGCETSRLSDAAAAAAERDALAKLRDEAAGRIVRIGRDADDQLRACQAVIRADRDAK